MPGARPPAAQVMSGRVGMAVRAAWPQVHPVICSNTQSRAGI